MSLEYPCVYFENEHCRLFSDDDVDSWCVMGPCSHEKMSNGDRYRAMSDEELASILGDKCICPPTGECTRQYGDCIACWLEWLQQPVKDGEE